MAVVFGSLAVVGTSNAGATKSRVIAAVCDTVILQQSGVEMGTTYDMPNGGRYVTVQLASGVYVEVAVPFDSVGPVIGKAYYFRKVDGRFDRKFALAKDCKDAPFWHSDF